MARKPNDIAPAEAGAINSNAVYEISIDRPFIYKNIQFLPSIDRVYRVKGSALAEIKDKVKSFYPVN